ncbi:MAG: hypothetical protein H6733_01840 [Alphaproteobacteria bacterium]|nr:hypothetical protein [Alphaproteobacteria bacterium]
MNAVRTFPTPIDTYCHALSALCAEAGPRLVARLSRRFPGTAPAQVEEAVQEAFFDACHPQRRAWFEEGWREGGTPELYRRLFTAGWRRTRARHRRVENGRTTAIEAMDGFDPTDPCQDPARQRLEAELDGWVETKVEEATRTFGRARKHALREALWDLVQAGDPVTCLARRHDLPRRYLAEASAWLRHEIEARAAA